MNHTLSDAGCKVNNKGNIFISYNIHNNVDSHNISQRVAC
nr:hypothetical protein [Citrobacter freundii]